jgi:histidinol-phosphate aminotransferase
VSSGSQVYTWEPSNAAIAARYGLRPEDILRFDTNTSPLPPPWLPEALSGPFQPPLNEYPDSSYADLTAAAAAYTGVEPHEVIVGAGADELLDLVAKAFLSPGTAALVPIPTYPMYGVLTTQRGGQIIPILRLGSADGYRLDVPAIVNRLGDVSVVWLCSPNNPTGLAETDQSLRAVLDATVHLDQPPLVVIDEAYHEFHGATAAGWRNAYRNLLVVRTVSKAFGLAGARVGWAAGHRSVIERMERVRPPGSISTVSAALAARALREPAYALANAASLSAEREWLASELALRGPVCPPSVCNFLLVPFPDQAAAERASEGLLRAGIVPRTFGPANPLRGQLRLTVRTRPENLRLLSVIEALSGSLSG